MRRTKALAPHSLMRMTSLLPCSSSSCASQPSRNAFLPSPSPFFPYSVACNTAHVSHALNLMVVELFDQL